MILLLLILSSTVHAGVNFSKVKSLDLFDSHRFKKKISSTLESDDQLPASVSLDGQAYHIEYSFDEKLEAYIKKQLKRFRSDYTSVIVIDNETGAIKAVVDYTRKTKKIGRKLGFSATHPAASVFKLITAADLIENKKINTETKFKYNGKSTTLYKYQLNNKKNRWTRSTDFKRAFAVSNNVVFGKAARNFSSINSIESMALKFGFYSDLAQYLMVDTSNLFKAQSDYNLAELASGFNKKTKISPLHGAVMSSIIANDGILKVPSAVIEIKNAKTEEVVWRKQSESKHVISQATAKELKQMMSLTVNKGTARGAFRKMRRSIKSKLEIGGKTGSITGGIPYGKRDWFVSYAKPKDGNGAGISIAVMIVNVKKWYIKSPYLAKNIIQYYYSKLNKLE